MTMSYQIGQSSTKEIITSISPFVYRKTNPFSQPLSDIFIFS